ncbi:MAG: MaoC family dehydratase [Anaerolineae bacterium]|nr:MaoC family dehydratase [Anaerolineae bacterium]
MPQGDLITTVEELKGWVGKEMGVSDWLEITQERVNQFADATDDHQFIHVDPQLAAQTPFGGTIAHGFLTLSLMVPLQAALKGVRLALPVRMGVNYGLNRVRFPAPVRVGKRVRLRSVLQAVEEVGGQAVQLTYQNTVEIEGEAKPACVAEWLARLYL